MWPDWWVWRVRSTVRVKVARFARVSRTTVVVAIAALLGACGSPVQIGSPTSPPVRCSDDDPPMCQDILQSAMDTMAEHLRFRPAAAPTVTEVDCTPYRSMLQVHPETQRCWQVDFYGLEAGFEGVVMVRDKPHGAYYRAQRESRGGPAVGP